MKKVIKFIIFIIFTILIFIIKDLKILAIIFLLNIILIEIMKININEMLYKLKKYLPFIIFTIIINIIFDSFYGGILIGIKIYICYNATYIYSKTVTLTEISETIQIICYPLKIFKINIKDIGIMISVAICMIPILKNEISTVIYSLKAKGKKINMKSIVIIIKPILISTLKRTNEIEKTLIAKAYIS